MKKDLADHVMEIIDAEQRCGHHMLYDGTEDIADRYSAILNMLIQIMEGREEGVVSFHNMRETKKLSPEALALILEYQDLDEHDLRWWIEDELEKSNYMDALIFRGMLGKTTSAKRAANREHIRRVVRAQQSRNRNAEHAFTGKGCLHRDHRRL
ncbi:MAG: hypothetical protein K6G16_00895 [Lachnospiraceae bacterium]|nr:hypothetical protein [Lachnospiraceae bacterium]